MWKMWKMCNNSNDLLIVYISLCELPSPYNSSNPYPGAVSLLLPFHQAPLTAPLQSVIDDFIFPDGNTR